MSNPFSGIISSDFKKIFNDAIDSLLEQNALTVKCSVKYSSTEQKVCNNCLFDSISRLSANLYNGSGPIPFPDNTICPVCGGMGVSTNDAQEFLYLGVIFDSKYFLNNANVNIVDGMVQTYCNISLMSKIRDANEIVFDSAIEKYGSYVYQRAGDPQPCGFGDNRYIVTLWKRK